MYIYADNAGTTKMSPVAIDAMTKCMNEAVSYTHLDVYKRQGIKVLASDDAKKVYTNCTAAVLRAKETVMNTVTTVQENAEDIYEGAKQINEERAEAKVAAEFAEEAEAAEEETTEEVEAEAEAAE